MSAFTLFSPHVLARLRSIEETIQGCTNTLYRACANASPQDMNDAMIGVSQQVNIMPLWINVRSTWTWSVLDYTVQMEILAGSGVLL